MGGKQLRGLILMLSTIFVLYLDHSMKKGHLSTPPLTVGKRGQGSHGCVGDACSVGCEWYIPSGSSNIIVEGRIGSML